jgi:hypothetical protein
VLLLAVKEGKALKCSQKVDAAAVSVIAKTFDAASSSTLKGLLRGP